MPTRGTESSSTELPKTATAADGGGSGWNADERDADEWDADERDAKWDEHVGLIWGFPTALGLGCSGQPLHNRRLSFRFF